MADYLVIVESPSKAGTIKKYLGKNYKVVASMGHLVDLPKSQIGVDIKNNFEPKYITIRGKGDLMSKLKKDAKEAKKVYLATDPDREGEAISWHLANVLSLDAKDKNRITFNEITKTAVKEGLKNPRQLDTNLVDAQQARRILDRIVGYQISPLLWKNVRKGLSAGRVQSVVTKLICDREAEIDAFTPKEYWSLTAKLNKEKAKQVFESKFYGNKNGKIEVSSKEEMDKILSGLENAEFIVDAVKTGVKERKPAPPFTTSTLQQEASRKLNFASKRTMRIAQSLYEGLEIKGKGTLGLITYMRTDSLRISTEASLAAKSYLSQNFTENYIPKYIPQYKTKKNAQDAHEAIRPTDVFLTPDLVKASLKPEQYRLYKLIWSRFVASQMTSAIYDTISADISANDYIFKTTGSKIKFAGFTAIYEESTDDEKKENNSVPSLEKGEILNLKELMPKQNFTTPPPRYTEATIIRTMEENGIGRPSTYSPTISTILERGYIKKEGKALFPTDLGKIVTALMEKHFQDIVDVDFTANMEKQLDEVEEGREWTAVLKDFYTPFEETLKKAESQIEKVEIKDEETDIPCEKCGRMMVVKQGRFGKFLACPGFPECRNTKSIAVELGVDCPKCGGKILVKKSAKGKKYFGCENNPTCDFMSWDEPLNRKCPDCGSMLVLNVFRGHKTLKCTNDDCKFTQKEGKK
ncbi:MAG: type I DNA topoisomerase [Clostridia bacterium]|nr:type I DNA topoisomerase [Clostridia bacterium]